MSKREDTAIVPYLDGLISQGFSHLDFIEAHSMRIDNALGYQYEEEPEEDMPAVGEIEEALIRMEYLLKKLEIATNRVGGIANSLLGYKKITV